MSDEDLGIECDLIDLSEIDLESLASLRDSVLAHSIHRMMLAVESSDEAAFGFQQSI